MKRRSLVDFLRISALLALAALALRPESIARSTPSQIRPSRVHGVRVVYGLPMYVEGSEPSILFPRDDVSQTFELTGLYKVDHSRTWSTYPQSPASIVGNQRQMPTGGSLAIAPLVRALPVGADALVTVQLRPVVERDPRYNERVVRFEALAVRRTVSTANARSVVERFHRQFHTDVLQCAQVAHGRGPLPPFDPTGSLHGAYDGGTRRLHFIASASRPLGMIVTADYVLAPPYRRIEAVRVHSYFLGE